MAGAELSNPALASALGACAHLLHQSGVLEGERLKKTRDFAMRLQEACFLEKPGRKGGGFDETGDNHHEMKRLEAAAYFSAVFRGDRQLGRIHEHNAAALDWLTARGDMTVNANHFAAISVCSMLNIFRVNDRLHALGNPRTGTCSNGFAIW